MRTLAHAEVALVKARVSEKVGSYRRAVIFFATAAVLAIAALVALLVGLILTIATLLGPGGATTAVVVATLVIALILVLIGKRSLSADAADQS